MVRILKIKCQVLSGTGRGSFFTDLPWVKSQFSKILGGEPFPGTLNVSLEDLTNRDLLELGHGKSFTIEPPSKNFYRGIVLPVTINDIVKGAIVIPQVPNYDPHLLELVASTNLRKLLSLKDDDTIILDF